MGDGGKSLKKYKIPEELEEGYSYEYRYKGHVVLLSLLTGLFIFMAFASIYDLIRHRDVFMACVRLFLVPMVILASWTPEQARMNRAKGVKLSVHKGEITVDSPGGTKQIVLSKIHSFQRPSLKPTIFDGAERYGVEGNSELIDRRFLVRAQS